MQGEKIVEPAEQAQECWLVPQWAGRGWITVLNTTVRVASLRRRGFRRDLRVESEPGGTQGRAFKAETKAEQRPFGICLICSRSLTGWRESLGTGGRLWRGLRKKTICQAMDREVTWSDLRLSRIILAAFLRVTYLGAIIANPEEGMATHSSVLAWRIPVERGAWQATVHQIAKCRTQLSEAQHIANPREVCCSWTNGELLGGPAVKTLNFHCQGLGCSLWLGN